MDYTRGGGGSGGRKGEVGSETEIVATWTGTRKAAAKVVADGMIRLLKHAAMSMQASRSRSSPQGGSSPDDWDSAIPGIAGAAKEPASPYLAKDEAD